MVNSHIALKGFSIKANNRWSTVTKRPLTAICLAWKGGLWPYYLGTATLNIISSCSWKRLLKPLGLLYLRSLVRTNERLLPQILNVYDFCTYTFFHLKLNTFACLQLVSIYRRHFAIEILHALFYRSVFLSQPYKPSLNLMQSVDWKLQTW